jgi:TatD DNase family protein
VPSAVGEIGLDRHIEPRDESLQEEAFRAQLSLAAELGRPVTIHCVQAWGWIMEILRTQRPLPEKMLFHSYGGSAEIIRPLAEMGGYFSYAGSLLREQAVNRRKALAATPPERLLFETDSPDIMPPHRFCVVPAADGRALNEPANLAGIVRGAAALLSTTYDELCRRTLSNARAFFGELLAGEL